ncbi:MAG: hypothetical protein ACK4F9_01370, partial [Brevinematia bacterium]
YDFFKDQIQLLSFNLSIDFFRLKIWKYLYLKTGFKFWRGSYTTEQEEIYYNGVYLELTKADFYGRLPYIAFKYFEDDVFLKVSVLPIIRGLSIISSEVGFKRSYYEGYNYRTVDILIKNEIPNQENDNYSSFLNWPFEFELGLGEDNWFFSLVFGIWFPDKPDSDISNFEWELGFNIVFRTFWWHPFSFLLK